MINKVRGTLIQTCRAPQREFRMNVLQKKICLLGAFAVGKTSLVRRYVEDRFDDRYLSTIGVKISRKTLTRGNNLLNLILWDLAGSDDFKDLQANYLRGASGAVLVCDLTRRETLGEFDRYREQVHSANPRAVMVLVANKSDLVSQRTISDADLKNLSELMPAPCVLASAKTGAGVEEIFTLIADQLGAQA